MKKAILKFSLICLVLVGMTGAALAQIPITIVNPGFELPGTGKISTGFANVTGWADAGVTYVSSGVELFPHTGAYRAYCQSGDSGAFQITGYKIHANDTITLTWWATDGYGGSAQTVQLLTAGSPGELGTAVASTVNALPSSYTQYTMTYTATPADVGQYVGIFFENSDTINTDYAGFDDFTMTVSNPSPVPVVVSPPTSQTKYAGDTVTFSVTAGGSPLNYQWKAGIVGSGVYTNLSDGGQFSGTATSNLVITNLQAGNQADYIVVVSNVSGSDTSAPAATLTINTSLPTVDTFPGSQSAFVGNTVTFTVGATGAVNYQWKAGAVGSGVYTNISNGGQFSGANSASLVITNLQVGNQADYVVVVSNGAGSANSINSFPPATLTIINAIYTELFNTPTNLNLSGNQNMSIIGWAADTGNGSAAPLALNPNLVYSYEGGAGNDAFYTTTTLENGSIQGQAAFPSIAVATATNLTFFVNAGYYNGFGAPNNPETYFMVQMNSGSWYISTTALDSPTAFQTAYSTISLPFNPSAANWNQLIVSGTGSVGTTNPVITGIPAASNLSGNITGAGWVSVHSGGSTGQYQDFVIGGLIPPPGNLPVINAQPANATNYSGTTAVFTVGATTNGTTAGLTYQWQSRPGVSGSFANVTGAQYSGTTSASLSVANLTALGNNQQEFIVIVADGAGSVSSTPPATLTVVASAPLLVTDTAITPNSVTAGNNNTVQFAASFTGSQPLNYQWQVSPNADGSNASSVSGATNSNYTLSNPQVASSGYYSLHAANGIGSSNSTWLQFMVAPASSAVYQWSAPVPFSSPVSLNVTQILNGVSGVYFEAAVFGNTPETVQVGNITYNFTADGSSASVTGGDGGGNYGGFSGDTGNASFNTCLNQFYFDGGTHQITMHNLTIGHSYAVQLFALDDRGGSVGRYATFQDPNNASDVSPTFAMQDNVYVVGTFTATSADMTIQQNLLNGGNGNINCLVVSTVTLPPPSPTVQRSGSNLQINWVLGTLLQATNVSGPWTTNPATPPSVIITPTAPRMFFRVQAP